MGRGVPARLSGVGRRADHFGPRRDRRAAPVRRSRGRSSDEGRPLIPLACSDVKTANIAWRLPLPAYSGSTPIVWGDLIFLNVATATNSGELELWAVNRRTQSVAWKRALADGNHMERKQNMSSPSPVTDGRHVWVMTGVGVLKGFDFAGQEILVAQHPDATTAGSVSTGATLRRRCSAATHSTCRCSTA